MKKVQLKRNPFLVKPVFANEVMVICEIKGESKTGKVEGFVRLLFTDAAGNVVSEVVISKLTAEALSKILPKNLKLIEEKMGEVKKKGGKRLVIPSYIG